MHNLQKVSGNKLNEIPHLVRNDRKLIWWNRRSGDLLQYFQTSKFIYANRHFFLLPI